MYNYISLTIFPTQSFPSLKDILFHTEQRLNKLFSTNQEIKISFLDDNRELDINQFNWKEEFELYEGTLTKIFNENPNDYFELNYYILSEEYPMGMASSGTLEYVLEDLKTSNTQTNISHFEEKYQSIKELDNIISIETNNASPFVTFFSLVCANEIGKLCKGIIDCESALSTENLYPCDANDFWSQLLKENKFQNLVNTIEKETTENDLLKKCNTFK